MRKAIRILLAAALVYFVFFADPACSALLTGEFQSFEEKTEAELLPMSETEPGVFIQYHTTVSFRDGQFIQQESDYFYSGPYGCKFGFVVAHPFSGGTLWGNYSPFSHTLFWNGQFYRYVPLP